MKFRISKTRNKAKGSVDANQMSNKELISFVDSKQPNRFRAKAKKVLAQRGVTI